MSDESRPSYVGMPYETLRRYVTGASDAAERRRVEAWAAESQERHAYLAALVRTWRASEADASPASRAETDAAWARLRSQIDVPADDSPPFVPAWEEPAVRINVRKRQPVRVFTGAFQPERSWLVPSVAAAALVVVAGTFLLEQAFPTESREPAVEMREVVTAAGQRAQVKLGDGSTVTLGVKSRLRFASDFGAHSREVYLDGQAHFVVVHDSTRPFTVHAAGSKTVDLGTAFVVRAYHGDERVQVAVTDGSVAFGKEQRNAPAPIVLTEGRLGSLDIGSGVPTVRNVDTSVYTSWLSGRLKFDDAPLSDVAAELGRWYDVDIRLADASLARATFTASFPAESFPEALTSVTTVLNLRAERTGRTVVLYRRAQ